MGSPFFLAHVGRPAILRRSWSKARKLEKMERMKSVKGAALALASLALTVGLAVPGAQAQQRKTPIWNVQLGTPVAELPPDYLIQACGTNGGPPSLPLAGFEEFALCPVDPETGLYEVWFSYDDEAEYYLRAIRARPEVIEGYRTNTLFLQLVIFSLLIDADGLVQGHRIISDPREEITRREDADISLSLKAVAYGALGWTCANLPLTDGERPIGDDYKKEVCEKEAGGRRITVESHRFLKAGQQAGRPGAPQEGEFSVGMRVELINADLAP